MNEKLKELLARHDATADERHAANLLQAQAWTDERARRHQMWLNDRVKEVERIRRQERVRQLVREHMAALVEAAHEDVPLEELLWGAVRYAVGALTCFELDEPVSLKVRRLGRNMDGSPIAF